MMWRSCVTSWDIKRQIIQVVIFSAWFWMYDVETGFVRLRSGVGGVCVSVVSVQT